MSEDRGGYIDQNHNNPGYATAADLESSLSIPPRLILLGETGSRFQRWMLSLEGQIVCEGIQSTFVTGLASFFPCFSIFNLQYQEEAACTLEFIPRPNTLQRILIVCFEKMVTTPVFQETVFPSAALQRKDVDLVVSYRVVEGVLKRLQELRSESEFKIVFEKAKERAEVAGSEFADKIPGETRPRKIPARYKYSSLSTGEDHHPENLEEFYRTRVYYTFLDTITQEMVYTV
ncbi:unnamed protein product [Leuciscus chuanchicus]